MLYTISEPTIVAFFGLVFGIITLCYIGISRLGDNPLRSTMYVCIPIIWGVFSAFVTLYTQNYWWFLIGSVVILLPLLTAFLYRRYQDHVTERELRTWSGKPDEQPLILRDIRALAESRGGMLLSDQFNNVHKTLSWRCGNGHTWEATPLAVYRGHWCPICTWNAGFRNRRDKLVPHDFLQVLTPA